MDNIFCPVCDCKRKKSPIGTQKTGPENFSGPAPFPNPYKPWSLERVFDLIHSSGGIVIFAHPGYQQRVPYLDELLSLGIDGVEVMHPDNAKSGPDCCRMLREWADRNRMYVSGGTDHSGLMGGQYAFFSGPVEECPRYIPSLKFGAREEDFRNIQNRIYG